MSGDLIAKIEALKDDRRVALNLQATAETRIIGLSRQIRGLERELRTALEKGERG